jgi:hypothetical protein
MSLNHRNLGATAIERTFHPAAFIRSIIGSTYIVEAIHTLLKVVFEAFPSGFHDFPQNQWSMLSSNYIEPHGVNPNQSTR